MKLIEIQMLPVNGLPENCEATVDLQSEQVPFLKIAYDALAEPFEHVLQKASPDFLLLDFAPYWISQVAVKFGICTAYFSVSTAATLAFMGSPAELMSVKQCPSPEMNRRDHATEDMLNKQVPDGSGFSTGQRLGRVMHDSSFVLVRTCQEFEGEYIHKIQELYQKPVLPIGVLPPIPEENKNTSISSSCPDTFQWLDGQKPKSVLFVGFGSEYKMPLDQIHELAFSLELSRLPFIWILRKPQGVDSSDLLPPGFANRTQSQGVVVLGWAPQQEILAHPAIGGCLFHSGWGTAVESLVHGHPLVLLPMVADQGVVATLLVEKQVGYEVPRSEDGSFSRDMVVESIRRVLVEEEGKQLRSKAAEMSRVFGDHASQDNYINKFIEHLRKHHHSSYERNQSSIETVKRDDL